MFQLFRLLICQNVKLGKCEDGLSRHQKKTQDAKFLSDRVSPQQEEEGQGEIRKKLNCEIYCDIFSTVQERFWRWGQWKREGKVKKRLKWGSEVRGKLSRGEGSVFLQHQDNSLSRSLSSSTSLPSPSSLSWYCLHHCHCLCHHHHYPRRIIIIIFIFVRLSIVQGKCEMDKCSILITITVVDINHWCCWNHHLYSMIDFPLPLCAILTRLQLLRRWFKILFERRYFATFFLLWIFDPKKVMDILPLKFTVT